MLKFTNQQLWNCEQCNKQFCKICLPIDFFELLYNNNDEEEEEEQEQEECEDEEKDYSEQETYNYGFSNNKAKDGWELDSDINTDSVTLYDEVNDLPYFKRCQQTAY